VARAVFLVLILANLIVFVWAAGYLGAGDTGREPERLQQQLLPGSLKVSRGGTPARAAGQVLLCRRVGPLGLAEAEAIDKAVAAGGGGTVRTSIDDVSYWVFIPAVAGQPAEQDVAALRKAGFKEFFVVTDEGPNLNAISLGLFPKEEAAKEKIARLVRNGIKSARIATQTRPTGRMMLTARGSPEALDKALAGLGAEPVDCPKE